MFKTQIRKTKEELNKMENLTMKEAFKRYKDRNYMRSTTYGEFYETNVDQKYKFDNILANKEFSKVNFYIDKY